MLVNNPSLSDITCHSDMAGNNPLKKIVLGYLITCVVVLFLKKMTEISRDKDDRNILYTDGNESPRILHRYVITMLEEYCETIVSIAGIHSLYCIYEPTHTQNRIHHHHIHQLFLIRNKSCKLKYLKLPHIEIKEYISKA